MFELSLGIYFKIKDRKLIDAETTDYPYLHYKLTKDAGSRNQDGLKIVRDKHKSDSVYRIIISGGSVVYGLELENSISANLEQMLNDSLMNSQIQVLNAGVPAYVIEQEFILIQLVLQYYNPDMIISLDGYNDLISTEINRFYPCPDILAPHNWKDFRPIKHQSQVRTLQGRFFGALPNLGRLKDFIHRGFLDKKNNYSLISNQKEEIAETYKNRVLDINAFCQGKEIDYLHFLQPLNLNPNSDREVCLRQIYNCMDNKLKNLDFYFSLEKILIENENLFIDECHVKVKGNQIIAKEIYNVVFNILQEEFQNDTIN